MAEQSEAMGRLQARVTELQNRLQESLEAQRRLSGEVDRITHDFLREVADRRRVEALLQHRLAELDASRRELNSFCRAIAHDLKSPLLILDGFSRILLEEHAADLSPDAQRFLRLIRDASGQMGTMVDHLSAFARLSARPVNPERLSMSDLAHEAWNALAPTAGNRRVQIRIGVLPDAFADRSMAREVLTQLLSNALKFTGPREEAVIEVTGERTGELNRYCVRDNGVGFDMQYAEKLFGLFQRLHRADEFPGPAVGLATVKRIVERHGGSVSASAERDAGATFCFTLPDNPRP